MSENYPHPSDYAHGGERPQSKSEIIKAIQAEITAELDDAANKQQRYEAGESKNDFLTLLRLQSYIDHLQVLSDFVLEAAQYDHMTSLSIDDFSLDSRTSQMTKPNRGLFPVNPGISAQNIEAETRTGKTAAIENFIQRITPTNVSGDTERRLYFRQWKDGTFIRNSFSRLDEVKGIFFLDLESRIPGVTMSYRLTPEGEAPERLLTFS